MDRGGRFGEPGHESDVGGGLVEVRLAVLVALVVGEERAAVLFLQEFGDAGVAQLLHQLAQRQVAARSLLFPRLRGRGELRHSVCTLGVERIGKNPRETYDLLTLLRRFSGELDWLFTLESRETGAE